MESRYWLCIDCTRAVVAGELPAGDVREITKGLDNLCRTGQPIMEIEADSSVSKNFSAIPCECCWRPLAGERFAFSLIPWGLP